MALFDFDESEYKRIIELYDTDASTLLTTLCDISQDIDKVQHCEFDWLRQAGLGGGSITLDLTTDDTIPTVGQWIVCKYNSTDVWYKGRIEEVTVNSPDGGISLRLFSLWSVLTEIQVGGNPWWDEGAKTFGRYDYFTNDPDHAVQVYTNITTLQQLVEKLYNDYLLPWGNGATILLDVIDAPTDADSFASMTFRGGESLNQVLRTVAEAAGDYSYGITADNKFFFKPKETSSQHTYQEGVNCNYSYTTDRSLMYNRLILTGGYVYGAPSTAGFYVWNYHAEDSASVALYGVTKSLTVKIPWIRNHVDSQNFADAFFAKYAIPTTRYSIQTIAQGYPLWPWMGGVTVVDQDSVTVNTNTFDSVKVTFNEAPRFSLTTGPSEPMYPGAKVVEPKDGESNSGAGGGGDAREVSGFDSVILSGISIDSCRWPPCEVKTMGFYVTSAFPASGYVVGDMYYSTKPVCPRTGLTVWDIETPFGQYVALDGLSGGEVVGRMGVAVFMRRYADHDINGCKWFMTGLSCP